MNEKVLQDIAESLRRIVILMQANLQGQGIDVDFNNKQKTNKGGKK